VSRESTQKQIEPVSPLEVDYEFLIKNLKKN
jgi:hypothetical protein